MLKNECYKIYAKPVVILFIIAAFIFNGVQLLYLEKSERNGYTNYTVEAYRKMWQDLSLYTEQNGGSWECALDKVEGMLLKLETEKNILYTKSHYAEKDLYETVRTEIAFTVNYKEYINSMYSSAEKLALLPMYSDKDSFVYKKLMITPKLYEGMDNVKPKCEPSLGISMAVNDEVTDVIAIAAIIFYICASLWQKEREQGLISLLRTSYRGRSGLAGCKILVLVVSVFFITLILYGTNIILAAQTYGLGDLSRPLASVYEFGTTHWDISLTGFFVCYILFKTIALIFLAFIVSLCFLLIRNTLLAQAVALASMVVSYILYFKIDALSLFSPVKYLSPMGILKTKNIFIGNISINFLSNPIQVEVCFLIITLAGIFACLIGIIYMFSGYEMGDGRTAHKRNVSLFKGYNGKHTSLFLHEAYKVLIKQKVLILLLLITGVQIFRSMPVEVVYYNVEAYYERFYLERLAGPVTEETILFIEEETEYLKGYQEEDRKERRAAFDKVKERYAYIQENEGAYFIYEDGIRQFTGYNLDNDIVTALFMMVVLSLIIPNFMAPDYQCGINKLLSVTFHGRNASMRFRYVLSILITILVFALVYVADFIRYNLSYEIPREYYDYPVNSIMHLSRWGSNVSIGEYLCVCTVVRIAAVMCIIFIIHILSEKIRSLVFADVAALAVFALPFAITYVKQQQSFVVPVYPYSWLAGNMALQDVRVFCIGAGIVVICIILHINKAIKVQRKFLLKGGKHID